MRRGLLLVSSFGIVALVLAIGIEEALSANAATTSNAKSVKATSAVAAVSVRNGGLVITVPRGMRRYVFRHDRRVVSVVVTSFVWKWRYPERPGSAHPLPLDGDKVWLSLARVPPASPLLKGLRRLRLPLSLHEPWVTLHHDHGAERDGYLHYRGQDYLIILYTGRRASPHARAAVLNALTSIHPAP